MMCSKRLSFLLTPAALVLGQLALAAGCGSSEQGSGPDPLMTRTEPAAPVPAAEEPGALPPESTAAPAGEEPAAQESPRSEGSPSAPLPLDGADSPAPPASDPMETAGPEPGTEAAPPGDPAQLPRLTVWIAGDSTVANGQTPCPRGWGGVIGGRFDARVTVNNSAAGGRSVHTWLYQVGQEIDPATGECALARDATGQPLLQARWQAMLDGMRPGDYLFIQFGINDGDPSCDRHVGLDAFETAYGMMADAAKARGAQPIFLTPVSSISCNGSTARGSRGAFVTRTIEAGQRFDVPVIDLHARSVELYNQHGFCPVVGGDVSASTTGPVGDFFCDDHTHFSPSGAVEIADVVVQALREQGIPLAAYLK